MRRRALVLFALFAAAGCSGRDIAQDAGDPARSLVRVELTYTQMGESPAEQSRFEAQAHFVRYRSFDPASVPTLLGIADWDQIAPGTCRVVDGTASLDEALAADDPTAEVSLLDAGTIEVRGPTDRAILQPAHYPDLVPFVSGVAYGAEETSPVSLGLGQAYQVSGEGGEEVGPFAATVTAPPAFPTLTFDALHRGSDLDLRWSGAADDPEPLRIAVRWSTRAGSQAVRCRVADDGQFTVPRELLAAIPPAAALTSATVSATRLARAALAAPGAGAGSFTVELRDLAPLTVVP